MPKNVVVHPSFSDQPFTPDLVTVSVYDTSKFKDFSITSTLYPASIASIVNGLFWIDLGVTDNASVPPPH